MTLPVGVRSTAASPNEARWSARGARIAVVDDDPDVRRMVCQYLDQEGYRTIELANGEELLRSMANSSPDVVILDIMLGSEDGMDVLAALRRTSDVPVIMLTGRSHEIDRVLGLKLGADDYVVKPFSPAELEARVTSILRRSRPRETEGRLEFDGLTIDTRTREVWVTDKVVDTTAKEFDLLAFLATSPRQVFSRPQLLEHVWDSSADWQAEGTVTEHIRRIRRKIEIDPDDPRWIRTVRGVGYRFEP